MALLSLVLLACTTTAPPESPPAPRAVAPAPAPPSEPEVAPSAAPVTLAADGSMFDPPVAVEAIPQGAWMCDMGDVHYARPDQGSGECPACGMALIQQGAAPAEP